MKLNTKPCCKVQQVDGKLKSSGVSGLVVGSCEVQWVADKL